MPPLLATAIVTVGECVRPCGGLDSLPHPEHLLIETLPCRFVQLLHVEGFAYGRQVDEAGHVKVGYNLVDDIADYIVRQLEQPELHIVEKKSNLHENTQRS